GSTRREPAGALELVPQPADAEGAPPIVGFHGWHRITRTICAVRDEGESTAIGRPGWRRDAVRHVRQPPGPARDRTVARDRDDLELRLLRPAIGEVGEPAAVRRPTRRTESLSTHGVSSATAGLVDREGDPQRASRLGRGDRPGPAVADLCQEVLVLEAIDALLRAAGIVEHQCPGK